MRQCNSNPLPAQCGRVREMERRERLRGVVTFRDGGAILRLCSVGCLFQSVSLVLVAPMRPVMIAKTPLQGLTLRTRWAERSKHIYKGQTVFIVGL